MDSATLSDVLKVCSPFLASGVVLFFMRRSFSAQDEKLDNHAKRLERYEAAQHGCQIDNERRFATWEAFNRVDTKVDHHEGRISALEAVSPVGGGKRQ